MDMHMGGHSMTANSFQAGHIKLAHDFWYIIAGVMGFLAACRAADYYKSQRR